MSLFASNHLNSLWNIIHPIRHMMSWFVPFLTSEQFVAPQDATLKSHRLALPFSTLLRPAQPTTLRPSLEKEIFSIQHLPNRCGENMRSLNEQLSASRLPPKHLRIFREHDLDVAPHCAGRMVISGRMKDVCAEIDRLARIKD